MALGKRRKHGQGFEAPKLQITSMMDMFTIILIFLLTCYSNKPEVIDMEKNLALPESIAQTDYQETIKLVLSQANLRLEEEVLATLQDGKISDLNPENLKESKLYQKLSFYRERAAQKNPDKEPQEHLIFLCDKRIPFQTINQVIKTAALAGYPHFQLAVLKK